MTSIRFSERVLIIPRIRTSVTRSWFRWGSEKERELNELRALYNECAHAYRAWREQGGLDEVVRRIPTDDLATSLLCQEDILFGIDEDVEHLDLKQSVELRDRLRAQLRFLKDPERVIGPLTETITTIVEGLQGDLPREGSSPFQVTRGDLVDAEIMERIINSFAGHSEFIELGIFERMGGQLYLNLCAASDLVPDVEQRRPFVAPSEYRGDLSIYVRYTPFEDYLASPLTLDVPRETYFSHMHVIGGSGAGKTQFLAQLILHHIKQDDPPSLVVVDSHGDLIPKLAALSALHNRLIYIDPRKPPSINLFSVDLFDYLFSGIVGADLTAKQSVFFGFLNRLMQAVPNATMLDLLNVMDDIGPYREIIAALPPLQKQFFERDFLSKTFAQTREQVRYRIHSLIQHPTMERLFTHSAEELDLKQALRTGCVILVDTSKEYLKTASPAFGRIFISLVLQAILDRASETYRHPTFLIVDEAAEYFDQNIDDLLVQVRKYRCGCVFAHQYLDQCAPSLRSSLASNTSIKMVSGVSMADARALAPDLRTTAEFILRQPRLQFATYIRGVTPQAVSIPVQPGLLDGEPRVNGYETFAEGDGGRVKADLGEAGRRSPMMDTSETAVDNNTRNHQPEPKPESRDIPNTDATEGW